MCFRDDLINEICGEGRVHARRVALQQMKSGNWKLEALVEGGRRRYPAAALLPGESIHVIPRAHRLTRSCVCGCP